MMADEPPLLELRGLGVRRGREVILEGVDLTVARASLHLIVGPNGAGKSTLLAGVLGQTAFSGRIVAHWRGDGRIGCVPQSFAVDRTLPVTVADFLALARQRFPVCLGVRAATRRRVRELLSRVGLSGAEDKPLSVLSGGELRRLLLANAIDPLPELLLLDEPASGLDEAAVRLLEEIVLELRRASQVTILMVSHDLGQVRRLADRVTVLNRRVRSDGPPSEALAGDLFETFLGVAGGARSVAAGRAGQEGQAAQPRRTDLLESLRLSGGAGEPRVKADGSLSRPQPAGASAVTGIGGVGGPRP
ncbi:MAG TPA: ATP-binding cassette domain-containing protein [Thermoanaerobaculia bacterium]|nr:ATP-binding cassette domain-containing protein [Thermoanaerobaculia bacterium]